MRLVALNVVRYVAFLLVLITSFTCLTPADKAEDPTQAIVHEDITIDSNGDVPDEEPIKQIVQYPRSRNVIIVGDSEACAVKHDVQAITDKIADSNGLPHDKIIVGCKVGSRIPFWDVHVRDVIDQHDRPDVVLVFLGTNHYDEVGEQPVKPILDYIELTGADCVWVGNTSVRGKRWKVNEVIKASVESRCKYFDTEAANIPLVDGIHPTSAGVVKWIEEIWPLIPPEYEATP